MPKVFATENVSGAFRLVNDVIHDLQEVPLIHWMCLMWQKNISNANILFWNALKRHSFTVRESKQILQHLIKKYRSIESSLFSVQKHEQIEQRSCLDTTQLDPMTALMLQGKNFSFWLQSVYKTFPGFI